jgi:phage/plasmid primase-like uncharacterized protein
MSKINEILSRLDKVKQTGSGKWQALCPSHDDKTPSLSIADEGGTIKIHCHACGANGIETIKSIGGESNWLFPESTKQNTRTTKAAPMPKKDNTGLAKAIYDKGKADCSGHPYIVAKGIKSPTGARRIKATAQELHVGRYEVIDALIIPIYCGNNPKISSLQIIWQKGDAFEKRFLKDCDKTLGWFAFGAKWSKSEKIAICEGISTGQSIIECTGMTVICAYSAGELPKIYQFVKEANKKAVIYIAVDADQAGREAAAKCRGAILVEPKDAPDKFDWNDEHVKRGGAEAVRLAFESAQLPPDKALNSVLDFDLYPTDFDLIKHIPANHILARMAQAASFKTFIPVNTCLLVGLGIFSSFSCRNYAISHEFDAGSVPIGLYVVAEQPSGAGKDWAMSDFMRPFENYFDASIQRVKNRIEDLESRDFLLDEEKEELKRLNKHFVTFYLSNTTPEALDKTLNGTAGFFSLISAESGLIDTITGASYGNGKPTNNDVLLYGFNGNRVAASRVTREAYIGNVVGSFVSFAQYETIQKIIGNAQGSGFSERFLMISEPHNLGNRDHFREARPDFSLRDEYQRMCAFSEGVFYQPKPLKDLKILRLNPSAFQAIRHYRNLIEPYLKEGKEYSSGVMLGIASKANIQIMKIAANLHLCSERRNEEFVEDELVYCAINLTNQMIKNTYKFCLNKGFIGQKAEFISILSLFETDQRPRTARNIIQAKNKTEPFKHLGQGVNKSKIIKQNLDEMVNVGILKMTYSVDNSELYSVL